MPQEQLEEKRDETAQTQQPKRKVKLWERWLFGYIIIWGIALVLYVIQTDVADLWKRFGVAFNQSKDAMLPIALFVTAVLGVDWAADRAVNILGIAEGPAGIIGKIAVMTGLQYLVARVAPGVWLNDDLVVLVGASVGVMVGLWLVDKAVIADGEKRS